MSKVSRVTGSCKWFDRKKGYGFIECPDGTDIFVHQTAIQVDGFRALYPEQEIEFTIETGPKGRPCATQVTGVSGAVLDTSARSRPRRRRRPQGDGSGEEKQTEEKEDDKKDSDDAGKKSRRRRRRPKKVRKVRNAAFVFIKPHAVTDAVKTYVSDELRARGISISREGSLSSEDIDQKKLIDQHYYAIASKATILKPEQLAVPADKFEETFKESWKSALEKKKVFNAMDGCKHLGLNADQLDTLWAQSKKAKKMVKFGGGFYCGLVEAKGKKPVYIFNGFFMSMRSKFTAPGGSIYWYSVHWDADQLSWEDFRGKVLGPTDPAEAPADSVRGKILADWKAMGLKSQPNVGDNGVHASASPFEGLAERINWLGFDVEKDHFGRALLATGVTDDTINDWSRDPQVTLPDGTTGSLFDALEDMNAQDCIDKCKLIAKV